MASIVVGGAPGMEIGAEITLQIVIQAALEVMIVAVASCKSSSSLPDTISVFPLYNSTSSKTPRGRTVTILYDPRYILFIKLSTSTMIGEGSYNSWEKRVWVKFGKMRFLLFLHSLYNHTSDLYFGVATGKHLQLKI